MLLPPPEQINQEHFVQSSRNHIIDQEKIYSFQGVNILLDDEIRYNDAKIRAQNERWIAPNPHQHICLSPENMGLPSRKSLPDDDSLTKSIFENVMNSRLNEDEKKLASNIKVYPSNINTKADYNFKKKTNINNKSTEHYQFESVPFRDNRETLPKPFSSQKDSSRKTNILNYDGDNTSKYILSDIGTKAPRQPVSKTFPIGVNTTINTVQR